MKLLCFKCDKEVEIKTSFKIMRNGTEHIEARCLQCNKFLKYLPQKKDVILTFGKHKGKKLTEIIEKYPDYTKWLKNKGIMELKIKRFELLKKLRKESNPISQIEIKLEIDKLEENMC